MTAPGTPAPDREHYSYAHYADAGVAEGFDALRFSGPIGRMVAEAQATLLLDALSPLAGRRVLDVGTGTGRAALTLASAGAEVVGLDASMEMLQVARARSKGAGTPVALGRADAMAIPIASQSVDAVVCFRLLMHVVDWRQTLAELCRVSRGQVIVDFPSARSAAALESVARGALQRVGRTVEAYRVMAARDVRAELARHGFRVSIERRQFVLPIALHKRVGRAGLTRGVEGALAAVGLLRLCGSPVTMVAER